MTKQEFDTAYENGYKNGYEAGRAETVRGQQAEWLKHDALMEHECKCSKCNKDVLDFIGVDNTETAFVAEHMNYCPNCGADMKGDKHVND